MGISFTRFLALALLALSLTPAWAKDHYADATRVFRNAGESGEFFSKSYGYALFPSIGKAGVGVGGAFGKGHVYVKGQVVGDTSVSQLTAGLQLGGQAYSQIIFFENKQAFDKFAAHEFEFSAGASAVLITAGATAEAGTTGTSASASVTKKDATTTGKYENGMVVFNIVKGGAMYEASLGGQHYKYKPLK